MLFEWEGVRDCPDHFGMQENSKTKSRHQNEVDLLIDYSANQNSPSLTFQWLIIRFKSLTASVSKIFSTLRSFAKFCQYPFTPLGHGTDLGAPAASFSSSRKAEIQYLCTTENPWSWGCRIRKVFVHDVDKHP